MKLLFWLFFSMALVITEAHLLPICMGERYRCNGVCIPDDEPCDELVEVNGRIEILGRHCSVFVNNALPTPDLVTAALREQRVAGGVDLDRETERLDVTSTNASYQTSLTPYAAAVEIMNKTINGLGDENLREKLVIEKLAAILQSAEIVLDKKLPNWRADHPYPAVPEPKDYMRILDPGSPDAAVALAAPQENEAVVPPADVALAAPQENEAIVPPADAQANHPTHRPLHFEHLSFEDEPEEFTPSPPSFTARDIDE
ncbi:unnamed protein product, partial [Mesorhabditis spiculigera]